MLAFPNLKTGNFLTFPLENITILVLLVLRCNFQSWQYSWTAFNAFCRSPGVSAKTTVSSA